MKISVGIATTGRREQMKFTLLELSKQSQLPLTVVICPATENDYDPTIEADLPFKVITVSGPRGLCHQRNSILQHCKDSDIIIFFDDDFYPSPNFIVETAALMQNTEIVVATGKVLMDGAKSAGISHETAVEIIKNQPPIPPAEVAVSTNYGAYGCNMILRLKPIYEHNLQFDANLPLYGWQEDVDFSRVMSKYGKVVLSKRLTGVHLAVKSGRNSGIKFGYSQIANPIYLYKKNTVSFSFAAKLMSKNMMANLVLCLKPEPWVDRKGRLKGNFLAINDFFANRLHPTKILDLN